MASKPGATTDWDPSEYILRRRHCPEHVIRETLASMMQALGARQLVHLAFHNGAILGGLSFTLGYPDELGHKLDRLLAHTTGQSLVQACLKVARGRPNESVLDQKAVRHIAKEIAQLELAEYSLTDSEARLLSSHILAGVYLTNSGDPGGAQEPEDIHSILLIDLVPMAVGLLHESNLVHLLAVQIKSTAEASSLMDNAIMAHVADRLHPQGQDISELTFPAFVSSALDLALEVTNSTAGAVYMLTTSTGSPFERLDARGSEIFPDHIARELLATTVTHNLAVQRTSWSVGEVGESPLTSPSGGVFLLSPIGGSGADPWRPAIGAIVLFRIGRLNAFSAYDLALTRNVALRISLARTTDVMSRIGTVTSALRARTDWVTLLSSLPDASRVEWLKHVPIPTDVRLAAKRIAPALKDLAELTDSHSVSLRLALPWAKAKESHGLALIRVASFPTGNRNSALQVQTEEMGGLNWACMRNNEPAYSRDVSQEDDYVAVRESTASELSVPVREEGNLVGTLNLESPLHDAYEIIRPLILSFSGAIARTLADARASLEDHVIDSAAQALNHRHTMESTLDGLRKQVRAADVKSPLRRSLGSNIEDIQKQLDAMRKITSTRVERYATVPQILERAADEVSYLGELPVDMWSEKFATPISGTRTRALHVAITNILSNLMAYTSVASDEDEDMPLRKIAISTAWLENSNQLVLDFRNHADSYVDSGRITNLYRCPLPDSGGRLRVGGVLAGLNARRANARLQSALLDDGRTVRTTLIVPVEE